MTVLKSVVLCLALMNVGYFLWARGVAPSQPKPEAAPPPATLTLASEVPAQGPAAAGSAGPGPGTTIAGAAAGAATAFTGAAPAVAAERCMTVGPFKDVSAAARAAGTLRGGGYDPRQRVVDGEVWSGVWIYVPVSGSRTATEQAVAKLKAAGIQDGLQMPGPGDTPVISLGMYSDPKRARNRVAQIKALGLNPGVADRKRTGNLYWIDVDLKAGNGAPNPADLKAEAGRNNSLEVKTCPSGAAAGP